MNIAPLHPLATKPKRGAAVAAALAAIAAAMPKDIIAQLQTSMEKILYHPQARE